MARCSKFGMLNIPKDVDNQETFWGPVTEYITGLVLNYGISNTFVLEIP